MSPEEAIETGVLARLTHATYGITTAVSGGYCSPNGGVQLYQGQVSLEPEQLVEWARAGMDQGPLVLIMAGREMEDENDKAHVSVGTYSVHIYIATANYRTTHEGLIGDAGSDTRMPGIWDVRDDILDRLCNWSVVTNEDPMWRVGGNLITVEKGMCLYELVMRQVIGRYYAYTPFASLDTFEGLDTTLQKEPDAGTGEEFQVKDKIDVP